MAASGRTATTKAMGKGFTQHQHLIQTELPLRLLEEYGLGLSGGIELRRPGIAMRAQLHPHTAGFTSSWNSASWQGCFAN